MENGSKTSSLIPSLRKKMRDYMEERQAIANHYSNRLYPYRPNTLPFAKQPKATQAKKRTNKCNIEKHSKLRKVNVGYYPPAFQQNWVRHTFPTQPKAAEATFQASSVPSQQREALLTFLQAATVTATAAVPDVPNPPVTISSQTQKMPGYCVTCMPLGKQCPTNYPMPLNPN